ncbi:MAG: DUF456 domain-containing protein [Bacteroidales bacterium]|nr:DUF456 domain-containing protein [Bacteroidales bacterium]
MDTLLLIAAFILLVIGLLGCILPVIPGPPISFFGILLAHFTSKIQFSKINLIIFAALAITVTILDYVVPVWGTKKFGGSKAGQWGSTIGMIAGMLFFGPFGLILGPFLGALVAELITGKTNKEALSSGFGSLVGFLLGTGLKLAAATTDDGCFLSKKFGFTILILWACCLAWIPENLKSFACH